MKTRILFQGDSITDFGRDRKAKEANTGLGSGYVSLIAARLLADHPEMKIYNRGVSGNRILDMYARWEEDAMLLDFAPDPVLQVGQAQQDAHYEKDRADADEDRQIYLDAHDDEHDHQHEGKGQDDDGSGGDLRPVKILVGIALGHGKILLFFHRFSGQKRAFVHNGEKAAYFYSQISSFNKNYFLTQKIGSRP